jgi:hypothetical protein
MEAVMTEWDEYKEYLVTFNKKRNKRCQCEQQEDAGGFSCPGVENCPYSDVEQGEEK